MADVVARLLQSVGLMPADPLPITVYPSPPYGAYPNSDDVSIARQHDLSYGETWAPEFTGESYTLLTGDPNAEPLEKRTVSLDNLRRVRGGGAIAGEFDEYYAKAALAARRSAIAMLGFDPSRTAIDVTRDPKKVNILGTYNRQTDEIYANAQDPSAIVHESLHRGLERLRATKFWKPEFDEIYNSLNEPAVRWLMHKRMGDPEGRSGDIDSQQVSKARGMFEQGSQARRLQKLLDDIEWAAAQHIAAKRPGGPR